MNGLMSLVSDDAECEGAHSFTTFALAWVVAWFSLLELLGVASAFLVVLAAWRGLAELKYRPPPDLVKIEYALRVAGRGRRNVESADMSGEL